MSGSVNKVILVGRLAADVEVRTFQSGGKVCNMRVVTNETWKDKTTGEKRERAEFHTVAVFNEGLVRVCEQYLKKGSTVYLEGQLQTRKWQDQSGADRYSTEVVLQGFNGTLVMLGGNQSNSQQSNGNGGDNSGGGTQSGGYGVPEDSIPFLYEWRV